jgi:hypothetical protein
MLKTIILGDEFDEKLKYRLIDKLKSMGANPLSSDWGIAGSQELDSLSVQIGGDVVNIESETFVGLSISGRDALVDEIARMVTA